MFLIFSTEYFLELVLCQHILFNGDNYSISAWAVHFKNPFPNDGLSACQIFGTTDTCTMNILKQVYFCVLLWVDRKLNF